MNIIAKSTKEKDKEILEKKTPTLENKQSNKTKKHCI